MSIGKILAILRISGEVLTKFLKRLTIKLVLEDYFYI